jgi:hypothetical protein
MTLVIIVHKHLNRDHIFSIKAHINLNRDLTFSIAHKDLPSTVTVAVL